MVFWTSVGYSNKPHSPAFAPPRAHPGLLSFALWRQRAPKLILTPKDETCLTRPQPSPLRSSSLHGKSGEQDKSGWKCSSGEGVRGASRYPHPAWGGPDKQTDAPQGTARFSFSDRRAATSPSPGPAWHSARLARRQTGSPRHPILPRSRWQFHRPTDFNFCKKRQQAPRKKPTWGRRCSSTTKRPSSMHGACAFLTQASITWLEVAWGRFSSLGIWLKGLKETWEMGAPPVRMRLSRASWEL